MANTIKQLFIEGVPIWVEVADLEIEGASVPAPGDTVETSNPPVGQTVERLTKVDLGPTLQAIIEPVHRALQVSRPEEVSVELAVGLKAGVGVFLATGEGNASVKVTAKWKFQRPADSNGGSAHGPA
jgi:hypothetical protein